MVINLSPKSLWKLKRGVSCLILKVTSVCMSLNYSKDYENIIQWEFRVTSQNLSKCKGRKILSLHFNCAEEIHWKILESKVNILFYYFYVIGKLTVIFQMLMMFLVYLVCVAWFTISFRGLYLCSLFIFHGRIADAGQAAAHSCCHCWLSWHAWTADDLCLAGLEAAEF